MSGDRERQRERERYVEEHTTALDPSLTQLSADAARELGHERMLSGPVVGRLLEMLVWATRARLVLEVGTFAGLSALAMAAGLEPDGRIVTCEIDQAHAAFARRRFEAAGLSERIDLRVGPALETIATLAGPFDVVFIDAEKSGYPAYYDAVLPKLSPHGLMAIDNTLFGGSVFDASDTDPGTEAMRQFNDMLSRDSRVHVVMLPIRDGVTLVRRRAA